MHGVSPDRGMMDIHDAVVRGEVDAVSRYLDSSHVVPRDLLHAASLGRAIDHETIARMLGRAHPPALMFKNERGHTPLSQAIRRRNYSVAAVYMDLCPEALSVADPYGWVPPSDVDMIETLLDGNPRVMDHVHANGSTWMHLAADHGVMVDFFLARRPEFAERTDDRRRTPLHRAARAGRRLAAEKLMRAYPDALAMEDRRGNLPLHLASESLDPDVVRPILDAYPAAARHVNRENRTPLFHMARFGFLLDADLERVLELCPSATLRQDTTLKFTPLHAVVYHQYYNWSRIACALVDAAPSAVFVKSKYGQTPLDYVHMCDESEDRGAFLSRVLKYYPLTIAGWALVPKPCRHVSRALAAALARSEDEARTVVLHMTPADVDRLRHALLVMNRVEKLERANFVTRRVVPHIF